MPRGSRSSPPSTTPRPTCCGHAALGRRPDLRRLGAVPGRRLLALAARSPGARRGRARRPPHPGPAPRGQRRHRGCVQRRPDHGVRRVRGAARPRRRAAPRRPAPGRRGDPAEPEADYLYSDEDKIDDAGGDRRPSSSPTGRPSGCARRCTPATQRAATLAGGRGRWLPARVQGFAGLGPRAAGHRACPPSRSRPAGAVPLAHAQLLGRPGRPRGQALGLRGRRTALQATATARAWKPSSSTTSSSPASTICPHGYGASHAGEHRHPHGGQVRDVRRAGDAGHEVCRSIIDVDGPDYEIVWYPAPTRWRCSRPCRRSARPASGGAVPLPFNFSSKH